MFPKTPLWFQKGVKCDGNRLFSRVKDQAGGWGGDTCLPGPPAVPEMKAL